jgi:plasmid maintenance system antidote protein VapI
MRLEEFLKEEFLKPLGITQSAFASRRGVSFPRLEEFIAGFRNRGERIRIGSNSNTALDIDMTPRQ